MTETDAKKLAAEVEALRAETARELEQIRAERAEVLADKVNLEADKLRIEAARDLETNRKRSDQRSADGEQDARGLASKLAREVSQDAIALAKETGAKEATLAIWQQNVDKHFVDNNGSIDRMAADIRALALKVEDVITGLAMKRATDASVAEEMKKRTAESIGVKEFRKWAVGLLVSAVGLYFAGGGHIG